MTFAERSAGSTPSSSEKDCGCFRSARKAIALFGSYGWGDGQWMRDWEDRCRAAGAVLAVESVMANEAPDDEALENCRALGQALA